MEQTYSSANTSINSVKLPMIYQNRFFHKFINDTFRGCLFSITDFGCGKFDNAKHYMEATYRGIEFFPFDKFNRTEEENILAMNVYSGIGVCSNVLNVIDSLEARLDLIHTISTHSRWAFFTVYEGDKSKNGKVSKTDCWQENRPTDDYIEEISQYFTTVERHGKVIFAHNE